MHEARTKATPTRPTGRWRPVERTRITNDDQDSRGGGVPIGARIVIYADKPREYNFEGTYDFEWNVEERHTPDATVERSVII